MRAKRGLNALFLNQNLNDGLEERHKVWNGGGSTKAVATAGYSSDNTNRLPRAAATLSN